MAADPPSVSLQEPDDCKKFHVSVAGDADEAAVAAALVDAGVGRDAPDHEHVYVDVDAVRSMAVGRVGKTWDADFAGMLEYATSKGWLDDDGTAIKAHIER